MAWPNTVDMSRDHEVWVDTETVLYDSKTGEQPHPEAQWATVQSTLWLAIKKDMLPADSPLLKMDLMVELPKLKLGAIVPKFKDMMKRADGTYWTVEIVEWVATQQEYRVHVMKSTKR